VLKNQLYSIDNVHTLYTQWSQYRMDGTFNGSFTEYITRLGLDTINAYITILDQCTCCQRHQQNRDVLSM